MDNFKRDNPFLDDDLIKAVTQKVKTNANEYAVKQKEELAVDALNCTFIHIGKL